ALPPGQAHPRDKLAALLWGDQAAELARYNLRQAIFALRKAFGAEARDCLRLDGDTVRLDVSHVEGDAETFERCVAEATPDACERAAELYRGDLLAGLTLQEAAFEDWLMPERERLRELAVEMLAKLLAHQRSGGRTDAAVQTALRLSALDPLQESV